METQEPRKIWPFGEWCKTRARIDASTGYRWRRKGILRAVEINGRPYVTAQEDRRFFESLEQGG